MNDIDNNIYVISDNELIWHSKKYRCAVGRNGISINKNEGDGKTPAGEFQIRKIFYRGDRIQNVLTSVSTQTILPDGGWCDEVNDESYNKFVKLPYACKHEKLWREDEIYDIIVVLGYNDNPVIRGRGSAIFIHIARSNFTPTDGCVALAREDLLEILKGVNSNTKVCISE